MFVARLVVASIALLFIALAAPPVRADVPSRGGVAHERKMRAESVGAPNSGKLRGAALLHGNKVLHLREGAHSWGLPSLVRLIQKAAHDVARKYRGSKLLVGDLSGRTGGRLDHHGSHQTGRDVDIGFYVANANGRPVSVKSFVAFDKRGHGKELAWARFDEARNWTLIESLLTNRDTDVRYVFVSPDLRAELLAYAARRHASKALTARAAQVMTSPGDAEVHDDHFHVRIGCPEAPREVCIEEAVARPAASARDGGGAEGVEDSSEADTQATKEEGR